jgi:elongation factor G
VCSSEIAFRIAAQTAIREVYASAGPAILEPIMKLEVRAPEEFQGTVMGQVNQRRGMIQDTSNDTGWVTINALVPLSEMFGYMSILRSMTEGRGSFNMEPARYDIVPQNVADEVIKSRK